MRVAKNGCASQWESASIPCVLYTTIAITIIIFIIIIIITIIITIGIMYIYIYIYVYNVFHGPHPVFSSILYVHVSEMLCTCQRCFERFPAVVHVSQKLCTCHRSCARFTSALITFVFNCIHTERILISKSIGATKHVLLIYTCMYVCMRACMYVCTYVRMYVCTYACMHACICQRTRYRRTNPHPVAWGRVGWGGIITSLAIPHEPDATLYDLQLQFHMNLMLRSMIFNCNSTHPHPIVWGGVGWDNNVIGISTWSWCYALWSSLAFPHDLDATLYDLHWHFHMNLMLRSMIFNCNSTWSWCYALWSSIAIPHDLDATFYDLHWHFHMILMLRSMIFIGISTWTWCYSLWSSIAIPHELDATLYDLHWHFHMILMLRSMIFNVRKSCGFPFWGWSDGRVVIPKVDGPFFSIGFECKNWLLAVRK